AVSGRSCGEFARRPEAGQASMGPIGPEPPRCRPNPRRDDMTTEVGGSPTSMTTVPGGLAVEANGINVIAESERKGTPRGLFWPWCAANIAVLAVSYGAFVLGFGLGLVQALAAAVVGT